VTYKLPGDVVESASIVMQDVSEPGRERGRKIRNAPIDHDGPPIDISSLERIKVAFWLDLEGWMGVTVEEPAYLAPCDSPVYVAPRKLVSGALKGIGHVS
jgi:hypothetical protein